MSIHHKSDAEIVATTHNVARFFTEHRQVSMILLIATFLWGWYGYQHMPKRKDPDIPVRVAAAQCQWPGATAGASRTTGHASHGTGGGAEYNDPFRQSIELRHPLAQLSPASPLSTSNSPTR